MELKNTTREHHAAYTSFNSWIEQAEERISEIEDQLNEIKLEGKIREKSIKRNEQSLQEIWDYVKRPNLRLNVTERTNPSWKILFRILFRKLPQPSKAGQYPSPGNTENTTKIFHKKRNSKAHNHQLHQGWNERRAARKTGQVTHKGKPIRLTADLSAEILQAKRGWEPIFNILEEKNFQPRISYPAKLS